MSNIEYNKDSQLIDTTKFRQCKTCNSIKPLSEFYINHIIYISHLCKDCDKKKDYDYGRTFDGFFTNLLSGMKKSAATRSKSGKNSAGICTIEFSYLIKLYQQQNGRCFYSGIEMTLKPHTSFKVSPERLNNNIGYIPGNVVLICREFNIPHIGWSREKILKIPDLINQEVNLDDLEDQIDEAKNRPPSNVKGNYKKITEKRIIDENGIERIECRFCFQMKIINHFTKVIKRGCKACQALNDEAYNATLRGFLTRLLYDAKQHAKLRKNKKSRTDNSGDFNLILDDLFDMILEQNGRCYYSSIPLIYKRNTDWKCSIERIDNTKGYVKDNVKLICVEFNVPDNTINAKSEVTSSSQWSKEKFQILFSHIMDVNVHSNIHQNTNPNIDQNANPNIDQNTNPNIDQNANPNIDQIINSDTHQNANSNTITN